MFRIVCDPSSGSTELCLTEITRGGSQIFFVCLVGVWQRNFEPAVCVRYDRLGTSVWPSDYCLGKNVYYCHNRDLASCKHSGDPCIWDSYFFTAISAASYPRHHFLTRQVSDHHNWISVGESSELLKDNWCSGSQICRLLETLMFLYLINMNIQSVSATAHWGCTNPGSRSPWRLFCKRWRQIFVGSEYGTFIRAVFWRLGYYSGSEILGKLVHPCI